MSLINSIAGIRGTIGGIVGENLTPIDTVIYASSFGTFLINNNPNEKIKVVIGRDARLSGEIIKSLVINTLISLGIDVVDIDLATTPTVALAVPIEKAHGGIIISASHNPINWNALKLLNNKGEFINLDDGSQIELISKKRDYLFSEVSFLGNHVIKNNYLKKHIDLILNLKIVNVKLIKSSNYKIVVDGVNSVGGIAVPELLKQLGVEVIPLFCDPTGYFPHNPEPLPEHIKDLSISVIKNKADLGIVVDPDVDRLAFVDEKGEPFGEEYTLVACADYVLSKKSGNTVSNLSSTKALKVITEKYGGKYFSSSVGEVNVVKLMKEKNAVIGGEGNGGVILPELHYGRDALVGIALFLSLLSYKNISVSKIKKELPAYYISKGKVSLKTEKDFSDILNEIKLKFKKYNPITIDGIKINFSHSWVHLRSSNTEPIIRVYSEANSQNEANDLTKKFIKELKVNL